MKKSVRFCLKLKRTSRKKATMSAKVSIQRISRWLWWKNMVWLMRQSRINPSIARSSSICCLRTTSAKDNAPLNHFPSRTASNSNKKTKRRSSQSSSTWTLSSLLRLWKCLRTTAKKLMTSLEWRFQWTSSRLASTILLNKKCPISKSTRSSKMSQYKKSNGKKNKKSWTTSARSQSSTSSKMSTQTSLKSSPSEKLRSKRLQKNATIVSTRRSCRLKSSTTWTTSINFPTKTLQLQKSLKKIMLTICRWRFNTTATSWKQ